VFSNLLPSIDIDAYNCANISEKLKLRLERRENLTEMSKYLITTVFFANPLDKSNWLNYSLIGYENFSVAEDLFQVIYNV